MGKSGLGLVPGNKVEITLTYFIPSSNTTTVGLVARDSAGREGSEVDPASITLDAETTVTLPAMTIVGGTGIRIYQAVAGGIVGSTAGDKIYIKNVSVKKLGATLDLEPEGITASDWQDSSTNNLDASYPATGYSVYPDGTGVRIASTANGSAYNFSSIEDGFSASGVHTIKIYDYLEMRFTKTPSWQALSGDLFEIALELEILP